MRIALVSCVIGASVLIGASARADGDGNDPQSTGTLQPSPYDTPSDKTDSSEAPVTWGSPSATTPPSAAPAPSKTSNEEVGGATVSFAVRNAAGSDIHHARVIMDGQVLSGALEGFAVTIPPGEHLFEFAAAGFVPQEHTVTIHAGVTAELLTVSLKPVEMPEEDLPPPFKPAPRGIGDVVAQDASAHAEASGDPWMVTYVTSGAAIVALGIGTALGLSSSAQVSNLRDTCAPNCSTSQIDSVKSEMTGADVAFAVGIVSGSVAILWAVTHPRSAPENKASAFLSVHGLSGQF